MIFEKGQSLKAASLNLLSRLIAGGRRPGVGSAGPEGAVVGADRPAAAPGFLANLYGQQGNSIDDHVDAPVSIRRMIRMRFRKEFFGVDLDALDWGDLIRGYGHHGLLEIILEPDPDDPEPYDVLVGSRRYGLLGYVVQNGLASGGFVHNNPLVPGALANSRDDWTGYKSGLKPAHDVPSGWPLQVQVLSLWSTLTLVYPLPAGSYPAWYGISALAATAAFAEEAA
jgi:hypothetical protein